eukprot:CAMPEP_0196652118 /NCGR_PEP_ID=MMETSP1086-20130531/1336_1 /TAXON_ID=77921 /ORGANISM="Cyanoptyche  gloeocystis , Strain SAG4.97" /LENGTH=436 /DNA_ID=CAMNT_0041982495 /DNA_START=352 /DNA_END=1662 /DNA_ORIENTATION=+
MSFKGSEKSRETLPDGHMDGGGGGRNNRNGGGDNGKGDDEGDEEDEEEKRRRRKGPWDLESLEAVLNERGMKISDLSEQLQQALEVGHLDAGTLTRYLNLQANPVFRGLLTTSIPLGQGLVGRLLADPNFLFKVAVEQVLALSTGVVVEMKSRGSSIRKELDYVASDLAILSLANLGTVWILAPSTSISHLAGRTQGVFRVLSSLPNHVFERSVPGKDLNLAHRAASLIFNTIYVAAITYGLGKAGSGLSSWLTSQRERSGRGRPQSGVLESPIVASPREVSLASASALSYAPRYQLVNGLDQVINEHLWRTNRLAGVALRYANSRLGEWALVHGSQAVSELPQVKGKLTALPSLPSRQIEPRFILNGTQATLVYERGAKIVEAAGGKSLEKARLFGEAFRKKAFQKPQQVNEQQMSPAEAILGGADAPATESSRN